MCAVQSGHVPFFEAFGDKLPDDSAFAYPSSNVVNSKVGKQTKWCEIVIHNRPLNLGELLTVRSWSW